jgi:ATP-dependent RNA helicase RhlE
MVPSDYLHRIGRTGRAGIEGDAISLVCVDEAPMLREIERLLGRPIPSEVVPGFAVDPSIRPEAIRLRSAGGGRPQQSRGPRRPGPTASANGWRPRPARRQQGRPSGSPTAHRGGGWVSLPGERTHR